MVTMGSDVGAMVGRPDNTGHDKQIPHQPVKATSHLSVDK
jgi:hypothetical protein